MPSRCANNHTNRASKTIGIFDGSGLLEDEKDLMVWAQHWYWLKMHFLSCRASLGIVLSHVTKTALPLNSSQDV